jgi:hypothetical protein
MGGGIEGRQTRARVWRNGAVAAIGAAVIATGAITAGAVAPASAGTAAGTAAGSKPREVTVKIAGIGLEGQPVPIPSNQTALWSLSAPAANVGPIYSDPRGQYRVPPGKYLAGGYVPVSAGEYENTVVVRQVDIRASETITLDSQGARPFSVALAGATASEQRQYADVCVGGGSGSRAWATSFLPSYVTPGGSQYVKAFADKDLVFVYHAIYTGTSGSVYDLAGARAGGLPADPSYSVPAAGLARLTVAARAGTVTGSQWGLSLNWQYRQANCGADLTPGTPAVTLPGSVTQYVSPGELNVGELGLTAANDFSYGQDISVGAGRSYTTTFNNAVAGPNTGAPTISDGRLCSMPGAIYGDPVASGWAADAAGTVTLHRGRQPLGTRGFGGFTACYGVNHKTGWYTMTESAHHASAPAGVTAATLSTGIALSWHFRVPALSPFAYASVVQLPATVSTFEPAGLNMANQVAPGSTSIRMHVIRNGGYAADMALRYALRSVRVQYSENGGRTWLSASVRARRGYWLVTVPSSGIAVSLRSTVTDVKGNSTVETIYNAYGVS